MLTKNGKRVIINVISNRVNHIDYRRYNIMKSGSVKVLSVLILILAIIIGGYLTFSIVLA